MNSDHHVLAVRTLFIVLLSNLIGYESNAQGVQPDDIGPSSYEVQLLPSSPEVSGLGRYGNTPINKYTGTANITIPIQALELDGLSIPLGLSYNTGGIKVAQDATWVGLGWNLSDGMVITREINGYDDLRNPGYSDGKDNVGWIYADDPLDPTDLRISGSDLYTMATNDWAINIPSDLEPDLFSLTTPNGSCKFYLPKKGATNEITARVVNNANYKITYNTDTYTFKVIDPDGFTYAFNVVERTTGFYNWDAPDAQTDVAALAGMTSWSVNQTKYTITAWRPQKVISPMGRELDFEYEQGFHLSYPSFSDSYSFPLNTVGNQTNGWYDPKEQTIPGPSSVSVSMNAFHNTYLTKIVGDFGEVRFLLGSERSDLLSVEAFALLRGHAGSWNPNLFPKVFNGKRLDAVEVYDPLGNRTKNVTFDYAYFNEDDSNSPDRERFLRLKLNGLQINGLAYRFSYFECDLLPPKDSRATDFWGYYNGADANTHGIPSSNRFYFVGPSPINGNVAHEQFHKFTGADRSSDAHYARYGLLNKVKYPTKGITEYRYEGNQVKLNKVLYSIETLMNPGLHPGLTGNGSSLYSSASYNFRYQYLKLQQDPTYSLYDEEDGYLTTGPDEDFEVGGLRIAEVVDRDFDGKQLRRRQYEYSLNSNQPAGTPNSSGVLMDDLIFHSKGNGSNWEYTPENYGNGYPVLHSNNMIRTMASAAGSHVGYSRVVERQLDSQGVDNGHTVTHYINEANQRVVRNIGCTPQFTGAAGSATCQLDYACWDGIDDCFDYGSDTYFHYNMSYGEVYVLGAMPIAQAHKNGKVVDETVYDTFGEKVRESHNTYEEITRAGNVADHYPVMNWLQAGTVFPIGHPYQVIDGNSFSANKEHRLKQAVSTSHFASGSLRDTTEYTYGVHNQLTKVVAKNSKGEVLTTKAYYPEDLPSEPFMDKLIDSNRTRIKVKSEVYNGSVSNPEQDLLVSQRNTFSDSHNPNGIVLPDQVITLKGALADGPEETRQHYEQYGTFGNLLQYRTGGGPPSSFVWGHHDQYVVAKVENADYTAIESILGQGLDLGANGLSASQEADLRNGLSGAMVTTYAHRPMVGLSAMTDPRQETRYYTYDTANRLHTVTDGGSNLLQDYAYGYVEDTTVFGCTDVPDTPQPMLKVVDGVTDTGATYVTFRVTASGGNGTYAYAWYHGIGSSSSNFGTVVAGNQDEFTLFVDCDEVQYVKLVVGSGTQELERVYANGNYPCLPGQDPENEE